MTAECASSRCVYRTGLTVFIALLCVTASAARLTAEDCFPNTADPFAGNWKGRWWEKEKVNPDIAAQVVAIANGRYRVRLVSKPFLRCPPLAIVEAEPKGDTLSFEGGGHWGKIKDGQFSGGRITGKATFEMKKTAYPSPTLGAAPPDGALVLFDGTNLDQWQDPVGWEILGDGTLMVTPKGRYLVTKEAFMDVTVHVEFRTPWIPRAKGQQRGNSGVFFQDAFEVQVLDSYGLEGYYNECGAVYKVSAPRVNAAAPPLEWQTYDITYRAPRFDTAGAVTALPRITVYHNGVCVQDDVELLWRSGYQEKERLSPMPTEPEPFKIQGHGNYLQYRNIWIQTLEE